MRVFIGILVAAFIGPLSPAMALDEPPATSPPPVSQPAPDSAASESGAKSTTTARSAPTPSTADGNATRSPSRDAKVKLVAGDSEADKQLKRFKAAGYKPEMRNGEVLFCRREAVLGSRFEKKVCNTAEGLDRQMIEARDAVDKVQRDSTISPRSN